MSHLSATVRRQVVRPSRGLLQRTRYSVTSQSADEQQRGEGEARRAYEVQGARVEEQKADQQGEILAGSGPQDAVADDGEVADEGCRGEGEGEERGDVQSEVADAVS